MHHRFAPLLAFLLMALASSNAVFDAVTSYRLPPSLPESQTLRTDWRNTETTTDYYALSLSWSPEYCTAEGNKSRDRIQCVENDFGFIVHGLWPQSKDARRREDHPRHCRPAKPIASETLRKHLCMMPSVELIQGEWQKHGTCAFATPEAYLDKIETLWSTLREPDRSALVGLGRVDQRRTFAAANRGIGLHADHVVVRAGPNDFLREILICYDKNYRFISCSPGGTPAAQRVHIRKGGGREHDGSTSCLNMASLLGAAGSGAR